PGSGQGLVAVGSVGVIPSCEGVNWFGSGLHQSKPCAVGVCAAVPAEFAYGSANPPPTSEVPSSETVSGWSGFGRITFIRSCGGAKYVVSRRWLQAMWVPV